MALNDFFSALGDALIPDTMRNIRAGQDRNAYGDAADVLRKYFQMQTQAPNQLPGLAQRKGFTDTQFNDDGSVASETPVAAGDQTQQVSAESLPASPFNKEVGGNYTAADMPAALRDFTNRKDDTQLDVFDKLMGSPTFAKQQLDTQANQMRMAPYLKNMPQYVRDAVPLGGDAAKTAFETYFKSQAPQEHAAGSSVTIPGPDGKPTTVYTAPVKTPIPEGFRASQDGGLEIIPGYADGLAAKAAAAKTPQEKSEIDARIKELNAQASLADQRGSLMSSTGIDDDAIKLRAEMWAAGDETGAFKGLPNSIYGSPARSAITNMGTQLRRQSGNGATGQDQVIASLNRTATGKALNTTAERGAKMDMNTAEAGPLADEALARSNDVARIGWVPFAKAQQLAENADNDPAYGRFVLANQGLITAYAQAMARNGVPTVSGNDHARELLSTAQNQANYEARIQQLKKEVDIARTAPAKVREELIRSLGGNPVKQEQAATAAPTSAPPGAPPNAKQAPDGNWYVPDPKRPNKYLMVQ